MNQPYETLFGLEKDHPIIGKYLVGAVPSWGQLKNTTTFEMLSSGEQKLVNIGLAIWNGNREASVADLAGVDDVHKARILAALLLCSYESGEVFKMIELHLDRASGIEA